MRDHFGKYAYQTHVGKLSNEKIAELIQIIQQGKKDAKTNTEEWQTAYHSLIEYFYPLAIKCASEYQYKYSGRVIQAEDYYQRAMETLCECAYNFDGTHFGIYVKNAIKHSLLDERSSFIHPLKIHQAYFLELGKIFSGKKSTLLKDESEKKLLEVTRKPLLLDDPVGEKQENTVGDVIPDPVSLEPILEDGKNWEKEVQLRFIRAGIDQLPERRKKVLFYRYGFDGESQTVREIGRILDLDSSSICRDERLAKEFLQKFCHVIPGRDMKDIDNYRNDARIFLGDTGGRRYADNLLDMGFREALDTFGQYWPYKDLIRTKIIEMDGDTAVISGMIDPGTEILSVRNQEGHLLNVTNYRTPGKIYLTFIGEDRYLVNAGETVQIEIGSPHRIKGLDDSVNTTIPESYAMILIKGAAAASMRIRARSVTEVFGKRPEDAENLFSQSQDIWESFLRDLKRIEKSTDPLPHGGFPI